MSPETRRRLLSSRLLLVTDPRPDLVQRVRAAVRGGVDIVQLRDKHASTEELLPLAGDLALECAGFGALFTVNDNVELARLCAENGTPADGVHLGQEDATTAESRLALGPNALVGRSAGSVEEARQAIANGADYLGIGAVYATPTKPDGDVSGPELLRALSAESVPVPWFAIGGVTRETAAEAAAAGAPGFAVVRAVLDAEDPEEAARELRSLLPEGPQTGESD